MARAVRRCKHCRKPFLVEGRRKCCSVACADAVAAEVRMRPIEPVEPIECDTDDLEDLEEDEGWVPSPEEIAQEAAKIRAGW